MNRNLLSYLGALLVVSTPLAGCAGTPPPHTNSWLSYKYNRACANCSDLTDTDEAINYYCAIGIDPTGCAETPANPKLSVDGWLGGFYFPLAASGTEAFAVYGNLGDLRIVRDMHCARSGTDVACYVSNWGVAPYDNVRQKTNCDWAGCDSRGVPFYDFPKLDFDLVKRVSDYPFPGVDHPFATVAMTFSGTNTGPNRVKFYTFDGNGNLLVNPALDGEGGKTNPRMCMACHGGTYDIGTHSVSGASFLPFDVYYFQYTDTVGFSLTGSVDAQQEGLRQLNDMVKTTSSRPAITEVIDGMYPDGVGNQNSKAVDGFVPSGWSGHENLYNSVVRQYCRTCHLASATDFATYQKFKSSAAGIENLVCETHDMPHAEVPYALFWLKDKLAQNDLREFLRNELPPGTDLHDCK